MKKLELELEEESDDQTNGSHPASEMFAAASRTSRKARPRAGGRDGKQAGAVVTSDSVYPRKRKPRSKTKRASAEESYEGITRSDRRVLGFLKKRQGKGESCKASIPNIAEGADVSTRQVQLSTQRLIDAGLLKRVGRDETNPERSERGTIYKVLI